MPRAQIWHGRPGGRPGGRTRAPDRRPVPRVSGL